MTKKGKDPSDALFASQGLIERVEVDDLGVRTFYDKDGNVVGHMCPLAAAEIVNCYGGRHGYDPDEKRD